MAKKKATEAVEEKVYLLTFLDSLSLTQAQQTYYEKTYKQYRDSKTYSEWKKIVKFVH